MSYQDDELDYQRTSAEEYRWFDAGFFFGLVMGGIAALLYFHATGIECVVFVALWGTAHHFKALQKLRSGIDWVEATVKRWAGL